MSQKYQEQDLCLGWQRQLNGPIQGLFFASLDACRGGVLVISTLLWGAGGVVKGGEGG